MVIRAALKWSGPVVGLALAAGCAAPAEPVAPAPAPAVPTVELTSAPPATRLAVEQPRGGSCAELLDALIRKSKIPWRQDGTAVARDDARSRPGSRTCAAETSSTATSPPAIFSILWYRPNPDFDTPAKVLERAGGRADGCTTELPGPPDGVTLALGCTKVSGSTLTTSTTVLAGPDGFVSVYVSTQHAGTKAAIARGRSFAADTARAVAATAFPLI